MEPFTEQEKRQLLTEIIKHSRIDNHSLFKILMASSVAPNWFHLALPNGRTVAQCQVALRAMGNEVSALGMKRKAPGEEPSSEGNNDVQSSSSQEPPAQPQPTVAQNPQVSVQHPSTIPMNPQQYQHQSGSPPKKKGRPAYAGRNAAGQRPFNPRPLAPMPPQQAVQNAQSSFRPIAPAPQLHPSTVAVIEPVVVSGLNPGLICASTAQQQGQMRVHSPIMRRAMEEIARQRREKERRLSLSQAPEQVSNRPRSNSEAVPSALKEPTEQDRSRSVELIEIKNRTSDVEEDESEQAQREENGSSNRDKGRRRSQRKA